MFFRRKKEKAIETPTVPQLPQDSMMYMVYGSPEYMERKRSSSERELMAPVYGSPEYMERKRSSSEQELMAPVYGSPKFMQRKNEPSEYAMMAPVYASPEYNDDRTATLNLNMNEYPLVHAREKMQMKFCRICGRLLRIPGGVCESCASNALLKADPDETMWFCMECEGSFPVSSLYCPFCGRKVK